MALAEGLDIKLNAAVKKVEYNQRGVEVTVYNSKNTQVLNTYHGNCSYLNIYHTQAQLASSGSREIPRYHAIFLLF